MKLTKIRKICKEKIPTNYRDPIQKRKQSRNNKIKKTTEELRTNSNNGGKIWEAKRTIIAKEKQSTK